MTELEYYKDLNAFKQLYNGLFKRFQEAEIYNPVLFFDLFDSQSKVNRHIRIWDTDFVRMPRSCMNAGIDLLVELESELNELLVY